MKPIGRPRLITQEEEENLAHCSKAKPFKVAKIRKSELALPVSLQTVRRRLREANLGGKRAARKQLLTPCNMMDRLGFAYQHRNWNALDWSTVIFSDEKMFSSDGTGNVWVHRPKGHRDDSRYVLQKRKSGRFSIGIWGWITAAGPGQLVRIEGNLTAIQYIDILKNSLLPALHLLFGDSIMTFMQDKSPIHMARVTSNWLAEQQHLRTMDWPARAADLNPIENLWADMVRDSYDVRTADDL